jgi:hypothetical protein
MATGRRVKRLKDLVDQIERLPESPERDRLLSEIRSRAVDLETGVTPRAMLPLREPEPPPVPIWGPMNHERATGIAPMAPRPPAAASTSAQPASTADRSQDGEESFWPVDRLLSLEDPLQRSPLPYVRARGDRRIAPWARGLRG